MKLQMQKQPYDRSDFQLTMISAISQESVVATQIVKGGVDSIVFENFIYKMLESVVSDPRNQNRDILIFMDNAVMHKHSRVLETLRKFKVNVLFNAQYSPWLNPVEHLFGQLKSKLILDKVANM